jgi:hypothetical protein
MGHAVRQTRIRVIEQDHFFFSSPSLSEGSHPTRQAWGQVSSYLGFCVQSQFHYCTLRPMVKAERFETGFPIHFCSVIQWRKVGVDPQILQVNLAADIENSIDITK